MATPPGPRPHPGPLPQLPLLTLDPGGGCVEAPSRARLPSASITCLLAFPAWLWGSAGYFFPLEVLLRELIFRLKGQQEDGERCEESCQHLTHSVKKEKKNPLLKQLEDAGENCGSLPVPGWRSSFSLGQSWKRD